MKRIGLLSDTHSFLDDRVYHYFEECDEIWHAGDIGSIEVADKLEIFKPLKAVYGNIDNAQLRRRYPENLHFTCAGVSVWITHIGGYPGRYNKRVREEIRLNPPKLFITGHSHILKIMPDKKLGLLHINPGAAGNIGFHKIRTLVRFSIDKGTISDVQVIELGSRTLKNNM
ncbi:MAG: metallophosphoesterase family protein [Bacteroidota bacterium]